MPSYAFPSSDGLLRTNEWNYFCWQDRKNNEIRPSFNIIRCARLYKVYIEWKLAG